MKISTVVTVLSLAAMSCMDGVGPHHVPPANAAAGNANVTDLVLRSYEVPNDGAGQLRSVLRDVMWFGSGGNDNKGQSVGKADVGPDGRLIVLAAPGVQAGVQNLIEQLAKTPPKPQQTVQVVYWLVLSTPAEKESTRVVGLNEVAPALAEIEKTDGPQHFTLQEKLTVSSVAAERAEMKGRNWSVRQLANVTATGLTAEINLDTHGPQRIDTRVHLAPGQIVVLGSSGAGERDKDASAGSLYYLIRAAIHDGTGK